MPDTGASGNSTAGMPQVKALLRIMPHLKVEDAPASIVEFGAGSATSKGRPTGQKAIKECYINTYIGPPDYMAYNPGRNFASTEFKEHAKSMNIRTHEAPVEAHNTIRKAERYYGILRRAYEILNEEIGTEMTAATALATGGTGTDAATALAGTGGGDEAGENAEADEEGLPRRSTRLNRGKHSRDENYTTAVTKAPVDPMTIYNTAFLTKAIFDDTFFDAALFDEALFVEDFLTEAFSDDALFDEAFIATKEQLDLELAIELRKRGVITTLGNPFEGSDRDEVKQLQDRGVF
ncbi:hypothetical protein MY11210_009227 [Beauveria gryllotalpidicola]